ncbi:MAG: inorganic phosphate transporter [Phycisphaeraceae bacterium]
MSMVVIVLVIGAFVLAWSNGANDNFKGVATLYGSGTASFRTALVWATGTTLAGSLASVLLAGALVATFSGKGLIAADAVGPGLLAAVGAAAAVTILLATWLGMPTSTTHALTGALVGAALVAAPAGINWHQLGVGFAQPLLLSPLLAIGLTSGIYPLLSHARRRAGLEAQTCLCIGREAPQPVTLTAAGTAVLTTASGPVSIRLGEQDQCVQRYTGQLVGVQAQPLVDVMHYLSGGAVCFARAVNDTPKIAALLLAGGVGGQMGVLGLIALAMAAGGLLQAWKVAETMSRRITELNPGQGLTANLMTASLVLGASSFGVPVSTTHVACGSIFGMGLVNGHRDWSTIARILTTWLSTLPLGLVLGALFYWLLR